MAPLLSRRSRSADRTPPAVERDSTGGSTAYVGDWLPIEALSHDGLLIRSDGALVRYLDVIPSNPLVMGVEDLQAHTDDFVRFLNTVPAHMAVQAYVTATPVPLEQLLAQGRAESDAATRDLVLSADPLRAAQGAALRQIAELHDEGLALHAHDLATHAIRYLVVVPWIPDLPVPGEGPQLPRRRRRTDPLTRDLDHHLRLARESLDHVESLKTDLAAADMKASVLDGPEVADVLWRHCAPQTARNNPAGAPSRAAATLLGSLDAPVDERAAVQAARRLRDAIGAGAVNLSDRARVTVDSDLTHTIYVSSRPEQTYYGWLLHAQQSAKPWTLSVHVSQRDRLTERDRYRRRERRLWGVNVGTADAGRRPDRDQLAQEEEHATVIDDLSTGGQSIQDVSIYLSLSEPGPEPDALALAEAVSAASRALSGSVECGVQRGEFMQPALWRSTLPLAIDVAERTFPLISRNTAQSLPLVSTSCGSPTGMPWAFADPGRTVERHNAFDSAHDNSTEIVVAKSGGGKTLSTIDKVSKALSRGAHATVIDRSRGHWRPLADALPGSVHLQIGAEDDDAVLNPWDVDDVAAVPRSKITFLLQLHALMVGEYNADADYSDLDKLERNLLSFAIREVYAQAALTGDTPCESFLHQVLLQLEKEAAADGNADHAAIYRSLAVRIQEFCADGQFAYLLDRPTSVPALHDAPLVVFNTWDVPEDVLDIVMLVATEAARSRISRRYTATHARIAAGYNRVGPYDGRSVLVFEELSRLLRRRASGEWVSDFALRGRHLEAWIIAISQQRSHTANQYGNDLLKNSSMLTILRQDAAELEHIAEAARLTPEEVLEITRLRTEKRSHSQAYFINGQRGRGTVTIRPGRRFYWLATSDRDDVPLRRRALHEVGYDPDADPIARSAAMFQALDLLSDDAWHHAQAAT